MNSKAVILKMVLLSAGAATMASGLNNAPFESSTLSSGCIVEKIVFSGNGSHVAIISSAYKADNSSDLRVSIDQKDYGPFDEIEIEPAGDDLYIRYSDVTHNAKFQKHSARLKSLLSSPEVAESNSDISPKKRQKVMEEIQELMAEIDVERKKIGFIFKGCLDSNFVSDKLSAISNDKTRWMLQVSRADRPEKIDSPQWFMYVDGVRYGPFDEITYEAAFSPDNKHAAFVFTRNNRMSLWLDKKVVAEHPKISMLEWRNNEKPDYAFQDSTKSLPEDLKRRLINNNRTVLLILQQTPSERTAEVLNEFKRNANYYSTHDTIIGPLFGNNGFKVSPDGKRVFCSRLEGYEKWYFSLDGKDNGPYKWIGDPVFSPDGKRVVIPVYVPSDKTRLWVDGKLMPADSGECDVPGFRPADQRFYCRVHRDSSYYVFLENKRVFGPFSVIDDLKPGTKPGQFSFTYTKRNVNGGFYFVYKNGSELGPFTEPVTLIEEQNHWAIAPQSNLFAYGDVIVDGRKFGPCRNVTSFQFSKGGDHFSFVFLPPEDSAQGITLNVDGKNYAPFPVEPEVVFSQDGKHYAFIRQDYTPERKRIMELLIDGFVARKADFIGFCVPDNSRLRIAEVNGQKVTISDIRLDASGQ